VIEGVEKLGIENLHYDILPTESKQVNYLIAAAITGGKSGLKTPVLISGCGSVKIELEQGR